MKVLQQTPSRLHTLGTTEHQKGRHCRCYTHVWADGIHVHDRAALRMISLSPVFSGSFEFNRRRINSIKSSNSIKSLGRSFPGNQIKVNRKLEVRQNVNPDSGFAVQTLH